MSRALGLFNGVTQADIGEWQAYLSHFPLWWLAGHGAKGRKSWNHQMAEVSQVQKIVAV